MKRISLICLTMLVAASSGKARAQADGASEGAATKPVSVTFRRESVTPLSALLSIALQHDVPLGIIFGEKPLLCEEPRSLDIKGLSLQDAFAAAVSGTGYTVSMVQKVYVLRAPDTTEHENSILNHRFDRFSAPKTTMSGIGGQLAGYLETVVDGAKGFALDILSNPDEKPLDIGVINNATTEEIANRIVLLGHKGVWIFRATPVPRQLTGMETPIEIFAYERDETQLRNVKCTNAQ